jgi:hypothetical protein
MTETFRTLVTRSERSRRAVLTAVGILAGLLLMEGRAVAQRALPPRKTVEPPAPLGAYVRGWQEAQVEAAFADQLVIYRNNWLQGSAVLGPYGRFHLNRILHRLPKTAYTVILQPELDERLNAARKLEIVNQLLAAGIRDAAARVIIDFPPAEGLYGEEAPRVFQQYLGGRGGNSGATGLGGGRSGFSTETGTSGFGGRGY